MTKILYWCVFCGYKEWVEAEAAEYRHCPRCDQGMFYEVIKEERKDGQD